MPITASTNAPDTRVWLANQEIITATHQQWAPASQAISLAADQSVVLRVEMQFAFNPTQYEHGVPHLLLYWERPGVARSIVPSSAFKKPANADGSGLQGTYRWRGTDGRLHSIVQTDASLDFIWPLRGLPRIGNRVGESPQMLLMVRGYWREMISPEKLVEMEQAGHIHPLILGGAEIAGSLSSGQREELLMLLARPQLITADPKTFWRFYRAFHVSAPEKATEMFGVWRPSW